jgi:hypothetical protein
MMILYQPNLEWPDARGTSVAAWTGGQYAGPCIPGSATADLATVWETSEDGAGWELCILMAWSHLSNLHSLTSPGIPKPNQDSVPASGHGYKLPAGYRVVKASVPGGLQHEYSLVKEAA